MIKKMFEIYLRNNGYHIAPGTNQRVNGYGFDYKVYNEEGVCYYISVVEELPPNEHYIPRRAIEQKIADIIQVKGSAEASLEYVMVVPDKPVYREVLKQQTPIWTTGQLQVFVVNNHGDVVDFHTEYIENLIPSDSESGFVS